MSPCGNSGWEGAPPRTEYATRDGSESKQNRAAGVTPILVREHFSWPRLCDLWMALVSCLCVGVYHPEADLPRAADGCAEYARSAV